MLKDCDTQIKLIDFFFSNRLKIGNEQVKFKIEGDVEEEQEEEINVHSGRRGSLKFDFNAELRQMLQINQGQLNSNVAARMSRRLKWMGKLQEINDRSDSSNVDGAQLFWERL